MNIKEKIAQSLLAQCSITIDSYSFGDKASLTIRSNVEIEISRDELVELVSETKEIHNLKEVKESEKNKNVTPKENRKEQKSISTEKTITKKEDEDHGVSSDIFNNRLAILKKLGLTYDNKDAYSLNDIKVSLREVKHLKDVPFNRMIDLMTKEIEKNNPKIKKPDGAQEVNAFNGNADNVGVNSITKEKKATAPKNLKSQDDKSVEEKIDTEKSFKPFSQPKTDEVKKDEPKEEKIEEKPKKDDKSNKKPKKKNTAFF